MRTFKFKASEIISTSTGDGHKESVLVLQMTDAGGFMSLTPEKQQGNIEGGPDPGGEATL